MFLRWAAQAIANSFTQLGLKAAQEYGWHELEGMQLALRASQAFEDAADRLQSGLRAPSPQARAVCLIVAEEEQSLLDIAAGVAHVLAQGDAVIVIAHTKRPAAVTEMVELLCDHRDTPEGSLNVVTGSDAVMARLARVQRDHTTQTSIVPTDESTYSEERTDGSFFHEVSPGSAFLINEKFASIPLIGTPEAKAARLHALLSTLFRTTEPPARGGTPDGAKARRKRK